MSWSRKELKAIDAAHDAHRTSCEAVRRAMDAGKSAAEIRRLEKASIEAARAYNRAASKKN